MRYLHGGISPGFNMVTGLQGHPHDAVGGHTKQLVLLFAVEPGHNEGSDRLDFSQGDLKNIIPIFYFPACFQSDILPKTFLPPPPSKCR